MYSLPKSKPLSVRLLEINLYKLAVRLLEISELNIIALELLERKIQLD